MNKRLLACDAFVEALNRNAVFGAWSFTSARMLAARPPTAAVFVVERMHPHPVLASGSQERLALKVIRATAANGAEDGVAEVESVRELGRRIGASTETDARHLARVYDVESSEWQGERIVGLLSELFPAGTMQDWLATAREHPKSWGPRSIDGVMAWIDDVAASLVTLHAWGFVHHDVKPSNLFVCREPERLPRGASEVRLLLGDFGAVRRMGPVRQFEFTPHYAPPHPAAEAGSPAFDVYSLACCVREFLTPVHDERVSPVHDRMDPAWWRRYPPAMRAEWIADADTRWWREMGVLLSEATAAVGRRPSATAFRDAVRRIGTAAQCRRRRRGLRVGAAVGVPLLAGVAAMSGVAFLEAGASKETEKQPSVAAVAPLVERSPSPLSEFRAQWDRARSESDRFEELVRGFRGEQGAVYRDWLTREPGPSPTEDPDAFATDRLQRAVLATANGDVDAALAYLDDALKWAGQRFELLYARGYVNRRASYWRAGISDFSAALQERPEDASALLNRSLCYLRMGELDAAFADADAACEAAPKRALVWVRRGEIRTLREEYEESIKDFTKALELNPTDAETFERRGAQYVHVGQEDKALADFDRSLELNPRRWSPWWRRAFLTWESDRDETLHALHQALRHCRNPQQRERISHYIREITGDKPD